ncbi:unnamed protein product [Cuscuta epithymum]|uniref:Uncharacterized protein n=1 Tax=Cuscuta epithymum TaxID=186058 RepID=A0AAV0EA54_9ASTE|nr:unnamed protein product [Cuscuta epithymum]
MANSYPCRIRLADYEIRNPMLMLRDMDTALLEDSDVMGWSFPMGVVYFQRRGVNMTVTFYCPAYPITTSGEAPSGHSDSSASVGAGSSVSSNQDNSFAVGISMDIAVEAFLLGLGFDSVTLKLQHESIRLDFQEPIVPHFPPVDHAIIPVTQLNVDMVSFIGLGDEGQIPTTILYDTFARLSGYMGPHFIVVRPHYGFVFYAQTTVRTRYPLHGVGAVGGRFSINPNELMHMLSISSGEMAHLLLREEKLHLSFDVVRIEKARVVVAIPQFGE